MTLTQPAFSFSWQGFTLWPVSLPSLVYFVECETGSAGSDMNDAKTIEAFFVDKVAEIDENDYPQYNYFIYEPLLTIWYRYNLASTVPLSSSPLPTLQTTVT